MLILNNKTGSGIVQLQEEVLTELTKLFKPNKKAVENERYKKSAS